MRIIKKTLFLVFILVASIAKGQFYGETALGYNFPIQTSNESFNNTIISEDFINTTNTEDIINIKFNNIMGPNMKIVLGYLLQERSRFSIECSYSNNNNLNNFNPNNKTLTTAFYIWNDGATEVNLTESRYSYYYSKKIMFSLQFAYIFKIKQFSISPTVDLAIRNITVLQDYIFTSTITRPEYPSLDFENSILEKYKYPFSGNFKSMLVLRFGIEFAYKLGEDFQFFSSLRRDFFNNRYLPITQIKYYSEVNNQNEPTIVNEDEFVFPSQLHGYLLLNTFDIQLGVRYYLNN